MTKEETLLIEIANRHAIYLEKYKSHEFKLYIPFLKRMAKQIKKRLLNEDLTEFSKARLEKLINSTTKDLRLLQGEFVDDLQRSSLDLAVYEAEFEARSLKQAVAHDFVIPTKGQLKSAIMTNPMGAKGMEGVLLDPFMKDMTNTAITQVGNAIRAGAYQGETTKQIIDKIIGKKSSRFTDGEFKKLHNSTESMVRTGLQHTAQQARNETWKRNRDIINEVQWVSTLDSDTSDICIGLDGDRFPLDSGPRPPIHIRCRSTTIPVLIDKLASVLDKGKTRAARDANGKHMSVEAKDTYHDWLKRQPKTIQDDVLGKKKGELFRDGGLTTKEFADANFNKKTYHTLTLKELRDKEPEAFARIEDSTD